MNKPCPICNHPSPAEVGRGLLTGVPRLDLAAQYAVSKAALSRQLRPGPQRTGCGTWR